MMTICFVTAVTALLVAAPAQAKICDRACLVSTTNAYLAALTAHSPAAAPLASNVLFVENVVRMKPGQGLWETATHGPIGLSLYVPDPVAQSAGWMGLMEESGKPVFVAVKLQLKGGKIVEAEHLVAQPRQRSTGRPPRRSACWPDYEDTGE